MGVGLKPFAAAPEVTPTELLAGGAVYCLGGGIACRGSEGAAEAIWELLNLASTTAAVAFVVLEALPVRTSGCPSWDRAELLPAEVFSFTLVL